MPLFDLLFSAATTPRPKKRPAGEELAGAIAWVVGPLLDYLIVSALDSTTRIELVLMVPAGLALATYVLGRRFGGRPAYCAGMAVLCAMTCYLATVAAAFSGMFL